VTPALPAVPALAVEGLRVETARGVRLLEDLGFTVGRGEILALVGESGSGKTMAARAALRLLPPGLRQTGGRIALAGTDLAALTPGQMRRVRGRQVGLVFQEPMASLNPSMRIGTQLVEALILHERIGRAAALARAVTMLARVRIADPAQALHAYPHAFSGGMRQRIMLASVMLLRPALLLADEPTTALDTLTQRDVLELIVELTRESGTAVLLITHDLGLVARYADRAVVLRAGRVVESGPARPLLATPRHAYTQALVAALPRPPARRAPPPVAPGSETPVLSCRDLAIGYPGPWRLFGRDPGPAVVDGASLDLAPGEILGLVGGSGSGKTTLGRALLGVLPIRAGSIAWRGIVLARASGAVRRAHRLGCQIVHQDPQGALDPRQRVRAIVAEPLRHAAELDAEARRRRVDEVLDEVGLSLYAERHPHALSGGQRQRVAIARAIVRRPAVVIADEPISALDMSIRRQILDLFRGLQSRHGFACLFVSHDLAAVGEIADRVAVMDGGRIVETGSTFDVLTAPAHSCTRRLIAASPVLPELRMPGAEPR
jgi:peptide/nickel transport system ATP-binding protein